MANPEDFEIIPDAPSNSPDPGKNRLWMWIAAAAILFVFAFAVGVGWATLSDRLGSGTATEAPLFPVTSQPGETPTNASATQIAVATQQAQATAQTGGTPAQGTTPPSTPAAPPATAAPTSTPQPPTPTPPPATRVCSVPLDPQFSTLFDPGVLGCPTAPTSIVWSAYEGFERGAMLWRSDTNLSYILYGDGTWGPSNETWDGQEPPSRGEPPPGLVRPERGFGYIWSVREDVFTRLGWATMPEKGFCAAIQEFERGFALSGAAVNSCTADNLYNHVFDPDWRPLTIAFDDNGRWRSTTTTWTPGGSTPATTPVPTATQTSDTSMRPAQNGVFTARRGQPARLDGRADDWPGPWIPVNNVIQGRENWSGPSDLSGAFQVMWAPEGMYLAVQVNDDALRAGPEGSNQWQGDGIEVQFDRVLAEDFADTTANDDDTQYGLAPDEDFAFVRGYRWLPLGAESPFSPPSAVTSDNGQYIIEALIPWLYVDLGPADLLPNQRFGFNLSINDNDSNDPAQQTVLSASPARTTHDNPTQWGTLVLGN